MAQQLQSRPGEQEDDQDSEYDRRHRQAANDPTDPRSDLPAGAEMGSEQDPARRMASRRPPVYDKPGNSYDGNNANVGKKLDNAENRSAADRGQQYDKTPTPGAINNAERSAGAGRKKQNENNEAGFFSDDEESEASPGWRRRIVKKYWKRAAFAGGAGGLTIGALMMFLSVSQGPLEFIHLAQLLEKFHFFSIEDAENNRLTAIARYIHDPTKPQNTRLGIVGNIAADHLESKLNAATGLESAYDPLTGTDNGYNVIKDSEQYKGKSLDEVRSQVSATYGIDPSQVKEITVGGEKVINVNPDPGGVNTVKRYFAQTKFSRTLLGEAGYNKLSAHVGSRVLGKRAGWTFHPIQKLDAAYRDALVKGGKAALDKLKEKINSSETTYEATGDTTRPGGTPSAQEQTDASGNKYTDPQSVSESQGASDLQNASQQLDPQNSDSKTTFTDSVGAKVASGGAALIGIACVIRNLDSSIAQERFGKVILPMMRKAGKFISMGSQAQSGQDIDVVQLGIYKNNFLDGMDKQGKTTSTWNQARSIQAENGENLTGPDLPKSDQVFDGTSSPFSFINSIPGLGTACGALNSVFGQIFSIATAPVATVVSGAIMSQALPALADWLSGSPVNPLASGAEFGNIVNYGARLSANDQFAAAGGVPLDQNQELALKSVDNTLDKQEFDSKSFAYRVFNTYDNRTLASHLIDQQDLTVPQNMASLFSGFGSIFKEAFKTPAMLLSGTSSATPSNYDYHGLKAVGFTADELGDKRFANPFQNACYVVGCHGGKTDISGIFEDSSKAQTYIDRAQKCFGVNISDDSGTWKTDSLTKAVNFQSSDYPSSDCESTDVDWLRVRFWMLDTPTMEAYACAQNLDDQSCQDLGLNDTGGGSGGGGGGVSPVSGDAQQLAQGILNNPNIDLTTYSSSVLQDVKDAAAGKPGTAGAMTSAALLQLIATLGQTHKVMITAIQSDGQGHCNNTPKSACPDDPHYTGDAVDFGSLDGVTISGRNPPSITVMRTAFTVLPKGSGFGQDQCGSQYSTNSELPDGFTTFDDTCNHLHVQVPKGTP